MNDDGLSGDAVAADGIHTGRLPAQPANTVVEFYVRAMDPLENVRTWPAPAGQLDGSFAPTANALYQVDDSDYPGGQPLYKLVMTEAERAELARIGNGCYNSAVPCESQSNAQMNGTFISIDGTGTECRYVIGIRNRGHGTRNRKPNNYRVHFRGDDPWKGVTALNLNAQFSWLQHFGAAISLKSGLAGPNSRAVQVRINNANLTTTNPDRTYGSYAANEALYYKTLDRLIRTTFSADEFNGLLDQTLDAYVPESVRSRMKNWMDARRAYVRSILPRNLPVDPPVARASGRPRSPTPNTAARFTIGGADVTHFRFRLDGGAFGAEAPVALPIELAGLPNGTHRLSVIARTANGRWQSESDPTVVEWIVDTSWPSVRISEVLAKNESAFSHNGTFPDLIELHNEGPAPVDLSGLRLTDDPANPNRFIFQAGTILSPGQYLLLFANRADGTPGIHLGFGLDQRGDSVLLFDRVANAGKLLDSVMFGRQLPDLSIARVEGDDWALARPTAASANAGQPTASPESNLKINEWLAAPRNSVTEEFIELRNGGALPVALDELYLTDNPIGLPLRHRLPPLSFVGAAEFAVFIADSRPNAGPDHLNFKLASVQGEIALMTSGARRIDSVIYGPQSEGEAIGRCPDGGTRLATLRIPTPGAPNTCQPAPATAPSVEILPFNAAWKYNDAGANLGTAWKEINYDDSSWRSGATAIGVENATLAVPIRTPIGSIAGKITFYFRTTFVMPITPPFSAVELTHEIDDGAIFYLNGQEIGQRFNLANGAVDFMTRAATVSDATISSFRLDPAAFRPGTNVFSVEVHQTAPTSSDIVFALQLVGLPVVDAVDLSSVVLNEIVAHNTALADVDGSYPDWIELYNPTSSAVDLEGMSLTDNLTTTRRWIFPSGTVISPREFLKVRSDSSKPTSSSNTGFGLAAEGGSLYLLDAPTRGGRIVSAIRYGIQPAGWAIGRVPDGGPAWTLIAPSPSTANVAVSLGDPTLLRINEWMAAPAAGSDWFEIFNPNSRPVELSGLHLSDDVTDPQKFQIPPLSFIGTGAFLRFDADDDARAGANHVNFKLNASGETLVLSTRAGELIDGIRFDSQLTDVSQGRLPDGGATLVSFAGTASPGRSNAQPLRMNIRWTATAGLQIQVNVSPGQSYSVQVRDSLSDGTWSKLIDIPIRATSETMLVTDPAFSGHSERYYRLVTPAQP